MATMNVKGEFLPNLSDTLRIIVGSARVYTNGTGDNNVFKAVNLPEESFPIKIQFQCRYTSGMFHYQTDNPDLDLQIRFDRQESANLFYVSRELTYAEVANGFNFSCLVQGLNTGDIWEGVDFTRNPIDLNNPEGNIPDPIYKNFVVGNYQATIPDPISQTMKTVVSQVGEVTYTAEIQVENEVTELTLGKNTKIDIVDYDNTVKLVCFPLSGSKFIQASYNNVNIPFTDYEIDYTLTTNQKEGDDELRAFYIQTEEETTTEPEPEPELWYVLEFIPNLLGKVTAKLVDEHNNFIRNLPIGEPFSMTSNDHYSGSFVGTGYSIILTPTQSAEIVKVSSDWDFDPITLTQYHFEPMAGATRGEWIKRGLTLDYERSGKYTIEIELLENAPDTIAPFNRLYLLDVETMHELSNIDLHLPDEEVNRTEYMINLLQIPFELPNEVVGAETGIVIGDLTTSVKSPVILSDVINISLGEIELEQGESSLDYVTQNSYELVLPFIESTISLNPNQVLGEVIRIEYSLDGYNGDLTVNLFNSDSETPFITNKAATGREIPIKLRSEHALYTGRMLGVDNGTLKAYIRAKKPELTAGQYANLVEVYGNLSEVRGYIEVNKIDLRSARATSDDKETIISLLSKGVIINE